MARRKLSVEDRIRALEEKKKFALEQAAKRIEALYNARIDLLREKGLKKPKERRGPLSPKVRVDLARDRYVFFRTRFWEHMGLPPEQAKAKAEIEYEKWRRKWIEEMFQ